MEKLIQEIERQIQRLQAAKQLLLETQTPENFGDPSPQSAASPVKRGRGRPRKNPLPPQSISEDTAA